MITQFIADAKEGKPVLISDIDHMFQGMDPQESQVMDCLLTQFEGWRQKRFTIRVPQFSGDNEADQVIRDFIQARIYNILSTLGGLKMDISIAKEYRVLLDYANTFNDIFDVSKSKDLRRGYGRCINVIDRMVETLSPDAEPFRFFVHASDSVPASSCLPSANTIDRETFTRVTQGLEGKTICGIDVGGTDIKIALVHDGKISCFKEYDWFPAKFTSSRQLVDPICMLVRLMRVKQTLDEQSEAGNLYDRMKEALKISATEQEMLDICRDVEATYPNNLAAIDRVGMCFPDVVISNKIVGGEVYKTRGIREALGTAYDEDFKVLTHLDDRIKKLLPEGGKIRIINDGPMASFTAAVEIAASEHPEGIHEGVFAHTLGTELGTGWVDECGAIPDIPLEVYNYIIDLGSYPEKEFPPDDLRSINNFNTGLPGTLQKYASQSGVFRLALKYFPLYRPDLMDELVKKQFVENRTVNGISGYYVPTEPVDMRKPFLEHMMTLPEREEDEVNKRIWKEIGIFLSSTWLETRTILNPAAQNRVLFGRLVKNKRCFDLMCEGAESIVPGISFEIADSNLAYTPLMRQLDADEHFTVAQFAQAVGAVYFANK